MSSIVIEKLVSIRLFISGTIFVDASFTSIQRDNEYTYLRDNTREETKSRILIRAAISKLGVSAV